MNVLVVLPEHIYRPSNTPGLYFIKPGADSPCGHGFDLIIIPHSVNSSTDPLVEHWLKCSVLTKLYKGGQIVIAGS